MDKYEMVHRWCNCNFGKNNGYSSRRTHVSCDENRFYSYSTVYAMWLDKTEGHKLMVIMDHGCSNTSRKHLSAIRQAIPGDVKYIETHLRGGYYGYANVDFGLSAWQTKLPFVLLQTISSSINPFKDSKTVNTRSNLNVIKRKADDINWLLEHRKDCKVGEINKYISKNPELKKIFVLVRKKVTAEEMIDKILGSGTYAAYEERLLPQKKAEKTRKFVAWFNSTHNSTKKPFTKKEINAMPIGDKVMRACLPPLEQWEIERGKWQYESTREAKLAKYLLGDYKDATCCSLKAESKVVTNRFTGEKYVFFERFDDNLYWDLNQSCKDFVAHIMYSKGYMHPYINLNEYKKLNNKNQWLKRFYQKCEIVSKRLEEIKIWMKIQLSTDDELNNCSEADLAKYNRIQLKFAAFLADKEAQRLAIEEERKRMEAEKLHLEQERKLKYDSYVARGIEGYRALYYEKLDSISVSRMFGDEFFFGGNVLLRWRTDEIIETSKNILLTIPQAKKIFKSVSAWHNDPNTFSECMLQTKSGNYKTNSYENDILTAGCHKVAYCEMERMYNEILKHQAI